MENELASWRRCIDLLYRPIRPADEICNVKPLERIRQVNILQLTQQISGGTSTLAAWLHDQMPRYVMAAQAARVAPSHPEILWKKYGAKFAGDVQSKRVLYGLQALGLAAPALGSDGGYLPPMRNVMQEVLEPVEYRAWLNSQG